MDSTPEMAALSFPFCYMLYLIKTREDLEKLTELLSLQDQVKALGFQNKLGIQNLHDSMKKNLNRH